MVSRIGFPQQPITMWRSKLYRTTATPVGRSPFGRSRGDRKLAPHVFRDFHSSDDVDYFTFTLDEATDITIDVGEGLHVLYQGIGSIRAINLELFDSDGDALPPSVQGVSPFVRPYSLEAGTYYIRLTPYSLLGTYYGVNHLFPSDLYVYPNTEYTEFIDDCSAKASDFDDPLYGCQWHLKATGP